MLLSTYHSASKCVHVYLYDLFGIMCCECKCLHECMFLCMCLAYVSISVHLRVLVSMCTCMCCNVKGLLEHINIM